jgi:hypothetical protein
VPRQTEEAFRRQAESDLVRFLQARAVELTPGGKLLIAGPGDDAQGRCCDGLYDVLNDALLELVGKDVIPRERYQRVLIPVYFRTVEELTAPLTRPDSPLAGTFTVDRAETMEVPTPFLVEFQRTGDVQGYAAEFTGFLRAFSEPIISAALAGPGFDAAVLDAVYAGVEARLLKEPDRYPFRSVQTAALLSRTEAAG